MTQTTARIRRAAIAVAAALPLIGFAAPTAHAQRVEPMSYQLGTTGSDATETLRMDNTSASPITVEVTVERMSIDEQGRETREPADDDFMIFPPQAIIAPGKSQSLRVKYVGDPALDASRSYRVSFNQLPIDLQTDDSGAIGMVINFRTLAVVAPKGAKADLHLVEAAPRPDGKWDVAVENRGNLMGRLSRSTWTFTDGTGASETLDERAVNDWANSNFVLPGQTLRLVVDPVGGLDPRSLTATIAVRT